MEHDGSVRQLDREETSSAAAVFEEPGRWRAAAALRLGLTGDDLVAALSPGASHPAALRTILAAIPDGATLLVDIGAGLGGPGAWFTAHSGVRVVGVEPSEPARAAAQRCFPELAMVDGEAGRVPLPDAAADVCTAIGVTSLLPDVRPLLVECRRLLRPGGLVAIADLFLLAGTSCELPPNTFRSHDVISGLLTELGFVDIEFACGPPGPDEEWSELARRVDDEVRREHRGEPAFEIWTRDQEHLDAAVRDQRLIGGCVIARVDARGAGPR